MLNLVFLEEDSKKSYLILVDLLFSIQGQSGTEVEIISVTELQSSHLTINKWSARHMKTEYENKQVRARDTSAQRKAAAPPRQVFNWFSLSFSPHEQGEERAMKQKRT